MWKLLTGVEMPSSSKYIPECKLFSNHSNIFLRYFWTELTNTATQPKKYFWKQCSPSLFTIERSNILLVLGTIWYNFAHQNNYKNFPVSDRTQYSSVFSTGQYVGWNKNNSLLFHMYNIYSAGPFLQRKF